MTIKNYEDSKCAWGFKSLCTSCAEVYYQLRDRKTHKHVNTEKEVTGFPISDCEECGRKCGNKYTGDLFAGPNIERLFEAMTKFHGTVINAGIDAPKWAAARLTLQRDLAALGIADRFDWSEES